MAPKNQESTKEPAWWGATPDWTPLAAKQAYRNAQAGNLQTAADLCDALRSDARIRSCLNTRANALLGCPLEFEGAGDGRKRTGVIKALDDGGEFWEMVPEAEATQVLTWGWLLNMGPGELVWRREDGVWKQRLVPKHPRNLRFDYVTRGWKLMVDSGKEIDFTPGDGHWVLFQPFGANNPWTHGLWWALTLLYLAKAYADFDWGRRNEARGRAALVGTTPDGAVDTDRDEFARQIASLRTQLGIALPSGYDLKAVDFGGDDHETFSTRIDKADASIAILLLGQNLSTEVKGGSFAAAKSHESVRQDYLERDAEGFATWCRAEVLRPWANVRFGDHENAPWPVWDTEPPEDLVQAADTTKKASEALALLLAKGVQVDVTAYCERFNIPLLETKTPVVALAPADEPGPASDDDAAPADKDA